MANNFKTAQALGQHLRYKRTSQFESIVSLCKNKCPKYSASLYSAISKFENGKFPTPEMVKGMEYFNTYLTMLDFGVQEKQEIVVSLPNLIPNLQNRRVRGPTRFIAKRTTRPIQKLKQLLRPDKTVLYGGPNGELKEGDYFFYNAVGVNSPGEENAVITTIFERCLCKKVKGHHILFRGLRNHFIESGGKGAEHLEYIYPRNLGVEHSLIDIVDTLQEADDILYKIAKQDAEKYANSVGIPFEDNTIRGKSSDK